MRSLDRLLRPKTIAVVGGGFFATNAIEQSLKMGFAGDIWPVHPTKAELAGRKAFSSVEELPAAPDAVFIGVNRHATVDIVRALAARGAGGAVCFASGFAEADGEGADLQAALVAAAGDMPVIGPNCYGLINYADGALLWPDQHGGGRLAEGERGVAIITQSSNIAINMTMQKRGLPVSFLMTAGNQAQTGLSEMALGLIEDARVSALGLHIEGFDSVSGFERLAARARELEKPVVAMKAGRSEQSRRGALTHTASLAGSDAAADAFLTRLGMARLHSVPAFLETLKLLHVHGPLAGARLSSMSCSGGEASVMADAAVGRRVNFPELQEAHRKRVKDTLGPLVSVANPLDYHTFIWGDEKAMTATFSAMVSGGFDLDMLVLDFPRADRCSDADWWPTVEAFRAVLKRNDARGAVVASLPENLPEEHAGRLMAMGIAPLAGIEEALDAVEAAAMVGEAWARPLNLPVNRPIPGLPEGGAGAFDEHRAKSLLADAGLPVPEGRRAGTPDEAVEAARALGFPLAVKALGIAHKSERQAVRLGLQSEADVRAAAGALAPLGSGLLVERMVGDGMAELIVGVTRDPVFGPVMTVGTGGVLAELVADTVTLLLPTTHTDIERALRGLRLFPLLDGYRGRPRADLVAATEAIVGLGAFAQRNADAIEELDVNPLIVCADGHGAWIADALMVAADRTDEKEANTQEDACQTS